VPASMVANAASASLNLPMRARKMGDSGICRWDKRVTVPGIGFVRGHESRSHGHHVRLAPNAQRKFGPQILLSMNDTVWYHLVFRDRKMQ
jgi:hypothetical protein